jgi:hypothetical protein
MATAQAAMVSNNTLISNANHDINVNQVLNDLDRQDVKDMLVSMGVNPEAAKTRVAQLTEAELAQLHSEIEQLPAGSGIIGAILVVFIVLVITDMLGATDVFSFVHNINRR